MILFLSGDFLKISPDLPLQSILKSSTRQAEEINRITNYFFWAAGFILLVVTILTFLFLYKFRERKSSLTNIKALNSKWEIAMIGVPSLLVMVFFYLTIKTMNKVLPAADNKVPDVVITAHQWWWEVKYPSTNVITANEIHLPVGKNILMRLISFDVVHDWWVPQFGNKMDMVPGSENNLWVNINEPGMYYGTCSEFCGAQHAHMQIRVVAQTKQDFNNWLKANEASSVVSLNQGAQLFMQKTCANCHRIGGTIANGITGPDLTHLGSRETLLAGMMINNEENLSNWIQHPQKIKPGSNMPDFLLSDEEARAIATYLYSLK
jgi:cytochrome c oxidase subunit 2